MHTRKNYAVTEVLGLITVVIIASMAIGVVLFWGMPQLDAKRESVRIDSTLIQFKTISDVIKDVSSGGANTSNYVDFVTDTGDISLDSKGDRFIFYYSLIKDFDFNVSDLNNDNAIILITILKTPTNWLPLRPDNFNLGCSLNIYYLNNSHFSCSSAFGPASGPDIPPNTYGSNSPWPLKDAVRMDILKINDHSIVGRIWLFDLGDISYKFVSSSETYKIVSENGGAISGYPSGYLYYEPSFFYNKNNSIVMKMIQLKAGDIKVVSGNGRYTFLVNSSTNYVREIKANVSGCFKMQIYGDNNVTWTNYLMKKQGFKQFKGTNIIYLKDDKIFSLVQSVCDIKLVTIE